MFSFSTKPNIQHINHHQSVYILVKMSQPRPRGKIYIYLGKFQNILNLCPGSFQNLIEIHRDVRGINMQFKKMKMPHCQQQQIWIKFRTDQFCGGRKKCGAILCISVRPGEYCILTLELLALLLQFTIVRCRHRAPAPLDSYPGKDLPGGISS